MSHRDQWKMIHVLNTCKPGGLTTPELGSLSLTCYYDTIKELIDDKIVTASDVRNGPFELHPIAQKVLNKFIVCRGDRTKKDVQVDQPSCFVIMPFGETWSDTVYTKIIEPAINDAGLQCIRGDEIERTGALNGNIFMTLQTVGLVIAEVSVPNPNVYYELGVADTLGKDSIIFTQLTREHKIATDKQGAHFLSYDINDITKSRNDLRDKLLQWATEQSAKNTPQFCK